ERAHAQVGQARQLTDGERGPLAHVSGSTASRHVRVKAFFEYNAPMLCEGVVVCGVGRVTTDEMPTTWAGERPRPPRLGRMDRYTRLALVAADAAVRDAALDPARWEGDRVAIVLGSALGSYETNDDWRASYARGEPSPRLFAATLPSTPVGEIAIHLA